MENKKSIGAFWKKVSSKGNEYYSGNVEIEGKKYYLAMFNNTRKTEEKHPDLQVYLSEAKKQ